MTEKEIQMCEKLEEEKYCYGYVYSDEQNCDIYVIPDKLESFGNFIGSNMNADHIVIKSATKMTMVTTIGCFLDRCPNNHFAAELQKTLVPIQQGIAQPSEPDWVSYETWSDYHTMSKEELIQKVTEHTENKSLTAVRQNGEALRFIENKTPKICMTAVRQSGTALQYVPEQLKTPEMCIAAVKENGEALYFVPETLESFEICKEAVKQTAGAAKYVSDPDMLEEVLAALEQEKQEETDRKAQINGTTEQKEPRDDISL